MLGLFWNHSLWCTVYHCALRSMGVSVPLYGNISKNRWLLNNGETMNFLFGCIKPLISVQAPGYWVLSFSFVSYRSSSGYHSYVLQWLLYFLFGMYIPNNLNMEKMVEIFYIGLFLDNLQQGKNLYIHFLGQWFSKTFQECTPCGIISLLSTP